jgi:hypothetical protein
VLHLEDRVLDLLVLVLCVPGQPLAGADLRAERRVCTDAPALAAPPGRVIIWLGPPA